MLVNINKIKIGKRMRMEYGEMAELAESIRQYGLLHPIVIDSDYNLVAGGRRLLATERLGHKEIEVKMLGKLTEKELRILELEENIRRKDLTEIEKSRNLVELVESKRDLAKQEFVSDSDINSIGRPKDNTSIKSISKELNIPRSTIIDAHQHVNAIDKYPELEELPKYKAIETAKTLDSIPKEDSIAHKNVIDLAKARTRKIAGNPEGTDPDEYIDFAYKVAKEYLDVIYKPLTTEVTPEKLRAWLTTFDSNITPEEMIEKIDRSIETLRTMKIFLSQNTRRKIR